MTIPLETRLLTRKEAAGYLHQLGYPIAASTLAKYATVGGGPAFISFGRKPLYSPSVLMEWAKARSTSHRTSTSQRAAQGAPHERP